MRVPPKIDAMIGITAAPIMPANAPRPDMTPKAAPSEMAAKLTVRPAVRSAENFRQSIVKEGVLGGNKEPGTDRKVRKGREIQPARLCFRRLKGGVVHSRQGNGLEVSNKVSGD